MVIHGSSASAPHIGKLQDEFLDRLPLPLFITSVTGEYVYCNQAFTAFFDKPLQSIVGSNIADFLSPNQTDYIMAINAKLNENKEAIDYDLTVVNGGGEPREMLIHKTIVYTETQKPYILGTMTDLTELKSLQRNQQTLLKFSEMLLRINQYITQCEDIQQLLDVMMEELKETFGGQSCGCILVNQGGTLRMAAQFGYTHEAMAGFNIRLIDSYFMRFAEGNIDQVLRINQIDLITEEDYTKVASSITGEEMLSSLSSPIIIDGELFALINFDAPKRDGFTDEQAGFMDYVRKQLAIAIKSMMLFEKTVQLSRNDQLTGLYNRHYFEDQIEGLIEGCRREGRQLQLVAVDADNLKRINDDRGHMAGDRLLIAVAEALQEACGPDAIISRHGGDEFVAAVVNLSNESLVRRLLAIRQKLAQTHFGDYPASFSFGVAVLSQSCGNYRQLLKEADEAMYAEKRLRMGERRRR